MCLITSLYPCMTIFSPLPHIINRHLSDIRAWIQPLHLDFISIMGRVKTLYPNTQGLNSQTHLEVQSSAFGHGPPEKGNCRLQTRTSTGLGLQGTLALNLFRLEAVS